MNQIKQFFMKMWLKFIAFFPSRLPSTAEQFGTWAASIFKTYDLEDKPGNRHAMASLIMHLGPTVAYKPKRYFSFAIMKSLANEVAFETMQSLKKAEKEYLEKHMNGALKVETKTEPTIDELRAESAH